MTDKSGTTATASTPSIPSTASTLSLNEDVAALSFEQARDELIRVVGELEQGAATLEHSLALWERGEALASRCEQWLIGAKARLNKARADSALGVESN